MAATSCSSVGSSHENILASQRLAFLVDPSVTIEVLPWLQGTMWMHRGVKYVFYLSFGRLVRT